MWSHSLHWKKYVSESFPRLPTFALNWSSPPQRGQRPGLMPVGCTAYSTHQQSEAGGRQMVQIKKRASRATNKKPLPAGGRAGRRYADQKAVTCRTNRNLAASFCSLGILLAAVYRSHDCSWIAPQPSRHAPRARLPEVQARLELSVRQPARAATPCRAQVPAWS